ncbi:chemotaxis protein CheX [Myxococcota bacterium]|nr:chemotaxis protein CheX [Myxococcota bacterium]
MDIPREDLIALVDQTWQTLFGDAIGESTAETAVDWGILSQIEIRGAWNGTMTLLFPAVVAEQIACRMLEAKPGELAAEEIRDASGEIANILAGNLKSMLPQPSTLGLPVVFSKEARQKPEFSENEPSSLILNWDGTPFSVIVRVKTGATGG